MTSTYATDALDLLKTRGYRITRPRRLVVEMLDKAEIPLSPYDLKDRLTADGERVDVVSLYRILECLEENHLVHRVLSSGKFKKCALEHEAHCERTQTDHCHHFLLCKVCSGIQEIHCVGMESLISEVARQAGFRVEDHHLEFSGVCSQCLRLKVSKA